MLSFGGETLPVTQVQFGMSFVSLVRPLPQPSSPLPMESVTNSDASTVVDVLVGKSVPQSSGGPPALLSTALPSSSKTLMSCTALADIGRSASPTVKQTNVSTRAPRRLLRRGLEVPTVPISLVSLRGARIPTKRHAPIGHLRL